MEHVQNWTHERNLDEGFLIYANATTSHLRAHAKILARPGPPSPTCYSLPMSADAAFRTFSLCPFSSSSLLPPNQRLCSFLLYAFSCLLQTLHHMLPESWLNVNQFMPFLFFSKPALLWIKYHTLTISLTALHDGLSPNLQPFLPPCLPCSLWFNNGILSDPPKHQTLPFLKLGMDFSPWHVSSPEELLWSSFPSYQTFPGETFSNPNSKSLS